MGEDARQWQLTPAKGSRGHSFYNSGVMSRMIGAQPITEVILWWHTDVLRAEQYEHVRVVQKSELENQKLEFELEVEQEVGSVIWFKINYIWITFWECSPISISNILFCILFLYILYLFYSQHCVCYTLYPIFYSFISYIYIYIYIFYSQHCVCYTLYPIFYSFISYIYIL